MSILIAPFGERIGERELLDAGERDFLHNNCRVARAPSPLVILANLDLTRVKERLQLIGWNKDKTERVEVEYKRFLKFHILHKGVKHEPTVDVDQMWHVHILDTARYRKDCDLIFGHYLDHVINEHGCQMGDGYGDG